MTIIEKLGKWKICVKDETVETFVAKFKDLGYKVEYDKATKTYYVVGTSILIYEG